MSKKIISLWRSPIMFRSAVYLKMNDLSIVEYVRLALYILLEEGITKSPVIKGRYPYQ